MITYRHITKIAAAIMAAAVCICFLAMAAADSITETVGGKAVAMEYESKLFDTEEPISINIIMKQEDWDEMLANAISETYYPCDVEINGSTFSNIGIRPKGNTSLSSIVNDPTTDRYSFKLEFDCYEEGKTCFGLDKLILNNNFADATNRKEALVYDMYQYLGADASLYNYAKISVNGEYWGMYLALEAVEDSFLLRNYGTKRGELYKPDNMRMRGGGGGMQPQGGGFGGREALSQEEKGAGRQGGMGGGNGANLNYIDDSLDSYSAIWEGEVGNTSEKDHQRVVTALKNISEGTELEKYMDIDNLLKYMAVHVFAVNQDSLSGNMAHNYYLYEQDSRLNIIPWDYNLSWGGMGGGAGNTSGVINDAIDSPFDATQFFDALLSDEKYLEQYHAYLSQLTEEYIFGGRLDEFYARVQSQVDPLVETDPTAFYSYSEYQEASEMLYEVLLLRGESIRGQLEGTIPSTDAGQRENTEALVDASNINLSVMGTMGAGRGGQGAEQGGQGVQQGGQGAEGSPFGRGGAGRGNGRGRGGMAPPGAGGEGMPEARDAAVLAEAGGESISDMPEFGETAAEPELGGEGMPEAREAAAAPPEAGEGASSENIMQGGQRRENIPAQGAGRKEALITYGICFLILLLALLFAKYYRRRPKGRH